MALTYCVKNAKASGIALPDDCQQVVSAFLGEGDERPEDWTREAKSMMRVVPLCKLQQILQIAKNKFVADPAVEDAGFAFFPAYEYVLLRNIYILVVLF